MGKPHPLFVAALIASLIVAAMAFSFSQNANARQFFSYLKADNTTAHSR